MAKVGSSSKYVLIDYENLQPAGSEIARLKDGTFKIRVYLGAARKDVPASFAEAVQPLGNRLKYISLEAPGKNALDFVIAHDIGLLSQQDPSATFHVIALDKGYDVLKKNLREKGEKVFRCKSIADLTKATPPHSCMSREDVMKAVKNLTKRKGAKPSTEKTLRSTLQALFKDFSEQQISDLFSTLCEQTYVKLDGKKVQYKLPA